MVVAAVTCGDGGAVVKFGIYNFSTITSVVGRQVKSNSYILTVSLLACLY
jgi:hypothetical protein